MQDPYPSLPPNDFAASRMLRLLAFGLVVATVAVSAFVVVFRWVWDAMVAPALHRPGYEVRVELIVPAIVVIALYVVYRLWDAQKLRGTRRT